MADQELALLETVELKFAISDSEDKFERTLDVFLTPSLLKLDSPHDIVKRKVMSICSHVNKRIKTTSQVKIPLAKLLDLFCTPTVGNLVRNFALIYIEMGVARMQDDEAAQVLPRLVKGISRRLVGQQVTLFHIILTILPKYREVRIDPLGPATVDPFDFANNREDAKYLLSKFLDVILYTTPPPPPKTVGQALSSPMTRVAPEDFVPRGLSPAELEFVRNGGKASWTTSSTELKTIKLAILKFLVPISTFPDTVHPISRFRIFLVGTTDANHDIISVAEEGIKKLPRIDWEADEVVDELYKMYQGYEGRSPAQVVLKQKIVSYLLKSASATNKFPQFLQVIFDALYGEETNNKLRNGGMAFVQWTARMASDTALRPVAPVLLQGLQKLIEDTKDDHSNEAETNRGFAYEALGLLAKRVPELFRSDISILTSLFEAVSQESKDVRFSVMNGLSSMIDAYKPSFKDQEKRLILEDILLHNIEKQEHPPRYSALKYATQIFPFSHPFARFICILGAGDPKLECKEMAMNGLKVPSNAEAPKFSEMVTFCQQKLARPFSSSVQAPGLRYLKSYSTESYTHMLDFIRGCMVIEADHSVRIQDVGTFIEGSVLKGETRDKVKNWLKATWNDEVNMMGEETGSLKNFLELIEVALTVDVGDAVLQSVASSCLLELISLGPSSLSQSFCDKITWIKSFLSSIKLETRLSMAHMLGIVATNALESKERAEKFKELVVELLNTAKDQTKQTTFEARHGSTLALGFLFGRLFYRYPSSFTNYVSESLLFDVVVLLSSELTATTSTSQIGACVALGEMARYGSLPLPEGTLEPIVTEGGPESEPSSPAVLSAVTPAIAIKEVSTKMDVVSRVIDLAKKSREVKVRDAALAALGHICVGNPTLAPVVLTFLYSTAMSITKDSELHFTIGEALCAIGASWSSSSMSEFLDIADVEFLPAASGVQNTALFEGILKKIEDLLSSGRPVVRKAVACWLLCLVKFSGTHPVIKNGIPKIHSLFQVLLTDRDDFTQDVASKGIGLSYELGGDDVKKSLVQNLVNTFSDGKNLGMGQVTTDTQLFDDGALGKTPDGGGAITTYQSVLQLASDLNNSDLVYSFLSLANQNAIWNSRRGATLGFSQLMEKAMESLRPYLPTLIPKLYRFSYDPSPKVADAMRSIWKSLVKEPKKAIDEYFEQIMKDLLENMGNRLWRTRQASCAALGDLLNGRQASELQPYMQDLWNMCFRALDDIKESVRETGFQTCKTLTNVTLRVTDPSLTSPTEGQKVMDIVMPFFLTKGLASMAENVQKFSLQTVIKLCKKGGVLLTPHLLEVISVMLESLTTFEPQVLNYLSFHVEKKEQLENARLNAAKSSPMMEAVDICVDLLDESNMATFTPKLSQILRRGMGLPTRCGASKVVVTLCMHKPQLVRQYADALLQPLVSGMITDRSPVVRKMYAAAIGHVTLLASSDAIQRIVSQLKDLYLKSMESDDADARIVAGTTILEMAKRARENIKDSWADILPHVFLGARDSNKDVQTVYKDAWDEVTGGSSGPIKLYATEFIATLSQLMNSQSWEIKKQVGMAVHDLAKVAEDTLRDHFHVLYPILVEGLSGRTWKGKESILEAFITLCVKSEEDFIKDEVKFMEAKKIVYREAKKNNLQYKKVAIECLGEFFEAFKLEEFDEVSEYLIETTKLEFDEDAMEVDGEELKSKILVLEIRCNAVRAFGSCFPLKSESQVKSLNVVLETLKKNFDSSSMATLMAIITCLEKIIAKLQWASATTVSADHARGLIDLIISCCEDHIKFTAARENGALALRDITKQVKDHALVKSAIGPQLVEKLTAMITKEPLPAIRDLFAECRSLLL